MSEPFIGEIRIFAGNFAPRNWAFCSGQLMPISQNTALFSLLGTTYGGDGRVTFALPNLKDSSPMQWGQGPGLTDRSLGERGGESSVTLISSEMPQHNHLMNANSAPGNNTSPAGTSFGNSGRGKPPFYTDQATLVPMAIQTTSVNGGSQPHNNRQPYLGLNFIIALNGIFPSRG
jgi:microcystin-dependent protein